MITEIGKCLQSIRINTGDSLRDMASKLNMSPAYLSSIENGKRNVPTNIFDSVCKAYQLTEVEKKQIYDAIYASSNNYRIDLSTLDSKKREVLLSLVDGEIDDDTVDKLCEVVKEKKNEKDKKVYF